MMQDVPVLTTKLYIPPPRANLVPRTHLLARLDGGASGPLTLLSAPAGFGKTTLLASWATGGERPIAWVSLDTDDNAPVRFWTHVLAALDRLVPGCGASMREALQSEPAPRYELLLTGVINRIGRSQSNPDNTPFYLILDDLHTITAAAVHETLAFLIDNLPPRLHLIIATRADPPWPLARLRVTGALTELRARDLRFSSAEVAHYLNDVRGLALTAAEIAGLDARTEGWPAGVQMAALALPAASGGANAGSRSHLIDAFSGSHRFVLDYLVEEVLSRLPQEANAFLLATSILERFNADLCAAVTGRDDCHALLADFDRRNLFLVPLDGERYWYRYHHLFRDLLRKRLDETAGIEPAALHQRASLWFESQNLIFEAAHHALAADDVARVARLAEASVLHLLDQGELGALAQWLARLPDDLIGVYPWLNTACAWAQVHAGNFTAARDCCDKLAGLLDSAEAPDDADTIRGHVYAVRLYAAAMLWDDRGQIDAYAAGALRHLPAADIRTRSLVNVLWAFVQRARHQYAAARQMLTTALVASRAAADPYATVDLLCQLARVEQQQGDLPRAADLCRQAIEHVTRQHEQTGVTLPVVSYAHATLGHVLLEQYQLDSARRALQTAADLSQAWGQFDSWLESQILLAQLDRIEGNAPAGLARLARVDNRHAAAPLYTGRTSARLRLAADDVAAAAAWAAECDIAFVDTIDGHGVHDNVLLARIRIAQHARGERITPSLRWIVSHLDNLALRLHAVDANTQAIKLRIVQGHGYAALGEMSRAQAAIEDALRLAQPGGFVTAFLEEGPWLIQCLRRVAPDAPGADLATTLLAHRASAGAAGFADDGASLSEPLSDRERQVLRLLASPLNSREIATELVIAPSTVRSHIKSIYSKLAVHRRLEAVERARELNLV